MLSPSVRVNTFVQGNEVTYIDPISKIFIVSETLFGFFRLPLSLRENLKLFYYMLVALYILILNAVFYYFTIINLDTTFRFIQWISIMQYIFCSVFGFICVKRLKTYYRTLNRFDLDVGCRPKISRLSIQNLVQTIFIVILNCILFMLPKQFDMLNLLHFQFLILCTAYTLEVGYYGHLLNLLVPRLKLINYYVESSLSNAKLESDSFIKEFVSLKKSDRNFTLGNCQMKKLMDLYHIIVEAYTFLIDAIKWQLLVIIISAFLSILGFLYVFSLGIIKGGTNILEGLCCELSLSVLIMLPLFAPCTFGDKVHHEVKRLRELLASRLYENKLDKSGRSIARALLAFTETRDLSFRLLRMLNIDISLPFKFMGLLVTYLIILLQFEKVINPGG